MAYPHPFLRLVLGGRIYQSDVWTMTLSLSDGGVATPAPPTEVPAGIIAGAEALIDTAYFSSQLGLQWLKLNQIGTDGRYTQDETVVYDYPSEVTGAATSSYPPPQIALAATFRTAASRGLAARGRIYLPLPAAQPQNTGVITSAAQLGVANDVTDFLNACSTALPGYSAVVASDKGAIRTIQQVSVGRVLDTIRSRRSSFVEEYVDATVPLD